MTEAATGRVADAEQPQGRPFGAAAVERGLLLLLIAAPLAHSTRGVDPVRLPELTLVLVAVAGLVATRVVVTVTQRRVPLPRSADRPSALAAVAAAALAVLALVAAFVTAAVPWRALLGEYGRADGALLVVASVVALLVALDRWDARAAWRLARAAMVVAALVGIHALAQLLGADPLGWRLPVEPGTATLGASSATAVVLASAAPLVLATAGHASGRRRVALAGAAVALAAVALVVSLAEALLGVVAGGGVALAAWLVGTGRGRAAWVAGLGSLAAGGGVLSGIAGAGPLRALAGFADGGAAWWGWQSAFAMAADAPLTGVGLGGFGGHVGVSRTGEAAAATAAPASAVDPHGVPAQLLAEGGVPLLAAWVLLQAAIAAGLVAGLRRWDGERYWRLAAAGAAWAVWLAVTVVASVGPAAWVWGVLLGGVVLVLARADAPVGSAEEGPPAPRPVAALAGVLAVALAVAAVLPLRADRIAGDAQEYAADGQFMEAVIALGAATDANPLEARYWRERAGLSVALGDGAAALDAYDEAARRDPRDAVAAVQAARVAERMDEPAVADARWRYAVALDPRHPPLLDEAAEHWVAHGEVARAEAALERGLEVDDAADRWVRLGRARLARDDVAGARAAFEEALARDPDVADELDGALP